MTTINPITAPSGYLDMVEFARLLKIHPQSVRRLVKHGAIPGVHLVHGKYLFEAEQAYQFASNYSPQPGRKPRYRLL